MSDDLRDRIAEVLTGHPVGGGYYRNIVSTDEARDMADELIEDLGLTVETRIDVPGKRGINPVSRVVGKWER